MFGVKDHFLPFSFILCVSALCFFFASLAALAVLHHLFVGPFFPAFDTYLLLPSSLQFRILSSSLEQLENSFSLPREGLVLTLFPRGTDRYIVR